MLNKNYDITKKKTTSTSCYRCAFIFLLLFASSFLITTIENGTEFLFFNTEPSSWESLRYDIEHDSNSFTIRTQGCTIPGLQPVSKEIEKFIKPPNNKIICPHSNSSLFLYNGTHITIQKQNFQYFGITKKNLIKCCYTPFYRPHSISDIEANNVDDRVSYKQCKEFTDSIKIKDEFVQASCQYKTQYDVVTHKQYFLHAIKKSIKINKSEQMNKTYNVVIMGLDAISRLNFYRTMPKTLKFLKDKNAIELFGYNKVGDNTFPNLIPMLLGISDSELRKTCLPNLRVPFDNCPFLWSWFDEKGYYTAIGEDSSFLGTFNYGKLGFYGYPVDYYLHTFINEAEDQTGNFKDFNSYLCIGDRLAYKVLLDYITSLTTLLSSSRLFGFFWEVTMSHDYLSYPVFLDDDYEKFFKDIESSGYLDDSIFFLVSDHGMRWGEIRQTRQGRLEEMLPFVHVLTPPSFQYDYPLAYSNLMINSRRLTTPFDIHATLEDLVNMNIDDKSIHSRSQKMYAEKRKISLFLPIPTNRTCETAQIADHWCTCHKENKYNDTSIEALLASRYLVWYMNRLLGDHDECAKLQLSKVLDVTEMLVPIHSEGKKENDKNITREFTVVVQTNPGDGIFEATMKHKEHLVPHDSWEVTGTVSRLNLYGDQSNCINDVHLELYCHCEK